jgi:hypothetical protein
LLIFKSVFIIIILSSLGNIVSNRSCPGGRDSSFGGLAVSFMTSSGAVADLDIIAGRDSWRQTDSVERVEVGVGRPFIFSLGGLCMIIGPSRSALKCGMLVSRNCTADWALRPDAGASLISPVLEAAAAIPADIGTAEVEREATDVFDAERLPERDIDIRDRSRGRSRLPSSP